MSVRLLDSTSTTGVSPEWNLGSGCFMHTVQSTSTGNPSAVVLELEGSLDGVTWYQLAEHSWTASEISNQQSMFHVTSKLVSYARLNLTTLSGGSSPTITAKYLGNGENVW